MRPGKVKHILTKKQRENVYIAEGKEMKRTRINYFHIYGFVYFQYTYKHDEYDVLRIV
jgi:hypothetical protein